MGVLDCISPSSAKITAIGSTEVFTIDAYNDNIARRDLESQSYESKSGSRGHSLWWNFFLDVPLLIFVIVFMVILELNVIPSHKSGFFCNDPNLSHPYHGETVSSSLLIIMVFLSPIFTVLVTEFLLTDSSYLDRSRVYHAGKTTLVLYRNYLHGFVGVMVVMEVIKVIAGYPRPNFFTVCEPDTGKTCKGSEYVSTFVCTSSYSPWKQNDASRSFLSGHTAFSVYCGIYIVWYLQRRAFSWTQRTVLLVPVLQLIAISLVVVCSLSRVTDYQHHWWDVLAGSVLGTVFAVFIVLALSNNFTQVSTTKTTKHSSDVQNSTSTLLYDCSTDLPVA